MSKETARVRRPSSRSAKQLKMLKELLPFLVSLITHSMCELYALNQTGYMHVYSASFITVCPLSVYWYRYHDRGESNRQRKRRGNGNVSDYLRRDWVAFKRTGGCTWFSTGWSVSSEKRPAKMLGLWRSNVSSVQLCKLQYSRVWIITNLQLTDQYHSERELRVELYVCTKLSSWGIHSAQEKI